MVVLDMVYPAILLPLLFAFDELRPSRPTFWLHVAVGFIYAADMLVVLHRWVVVVVCVCGGGGRGGGATTGGMQWH
jgi:hypothetical protein